MQHHLHHFSIPNNGQTRKHLRKVLAPIISSLPLIHAPLILAIQLLRPVACSFPRWRSSPCPSCWERRGARRAAPARTAGPLPRRHWRRSTSTSCSIRSCIRYVLARITLSWSLFYCVPEIEDPSRV